MNISRPKSFGKSALNKDPLAFVQLGRYDSEDIIARLLQSGLCQAAVTPGETTVEQILRAVQSED